MPIYLIYYIYTTLYTLKSYFSCQIILLPKHQSPTNKHINMVHPPLNATLRLIISPLPSLPLNNSLPRTADCLRTDAMHKPTKVKSKVK